MPIYRKPGVYINEISSFPPSVSPVATAIPAFIGYTQKREIRGKVLENAQPFKITSLLEFEQVFGGACNEKLLVTLSGRSNSHLDTSIKVETQYLMPVYNLYYYIAMFFANGGGACYIVSIGLYTDEEIPNPASKLIQFENLLEGLKAIKKVDETTLLIIPEAIHLIDSERNRIYSEMLSQCEKLKDRFAIFDVLQSQGGNVINDVSNFRNNIGNTNLKYGAAYYPSLKTSLSLKYDNESVLIVDKRRGAVYNNSANLENIQNGPDSDPHLYNLIISEIKNQLSVVVYPSAAIAGIYAMVDNNRGVWKAPANVSLNMVIETTMKISSKEQENMNIDPASGKSINAIRSFPGKGILVWGARTLAGNDNEWRYVSVRRFFNFVEESVKKATLFVVFEPNDANTWIKVKSMIENFLLGLWKNGALSGSKPEQAYFVKVGLGETMTAQDILENRMNIEIGMAVVKPAEFIILKYSHQLQSK